MLRIAIASISAALALSAALAWQTQRLASARSEVTRVRAEAEQARLAATVLDAHLRRMSVERERLQSTIDELSKLEGADAPLSPYLRAVLGRVR